jgi:uncharacterized damage-inducible protein DinB
MRDLAATVRNHQIAIAEFLDAVRAVPAEEWAEPRAPGKWSPAQVVEHVALVYELGLKLLKGTATDPSAPRWLRPIVGMIIRRTVLRTGRFMKSNAAAPFRPQRVPASRDVLVARLEEASRAFERSAVQEVEGGRSTFDHPAFGRFGVADYVQFQAHHTKHHQAQLRRVPSTS